MRIDKVLANSGFGTRKEVKKLLKTGVVTVDDKIIKDAKTHVDPNEQTIMVNDQVVDYKEYVYFMLNKPAGVISATEDDRDETVIDLLEPEHQIYDVFPVGRLDKDTEGLLLLTNDGVLAHQLLSPKKHVPKWYYAVIDGHVTEEDIVSFREGVTLDDGYETKPAELVILKEGAFSEVEICLTEGKFHQVKRMFEAVGKRVNYLQRYEMGPLKLDETLELGEYRELTEDEIDMLKNRE